MSDFQFPPDAPVKSRAVAAKPRSAPSRTKLVTAFFLATVMALGVPVAKAAIPDDVDVPPSKPVPGAERPAPIRVAAPTRVGRRRRTRTRGP